MMSRRNSPPTVKPVMACLALTIAVFSLGCESRPEYVPVSGKVTIDGEPLTNGIVRFYPTEGRMAGGSLGPNGEFVLSTYKSGDGAKPGVYRVSVIASERVSETKVRWHAPKKYSRPSSSGISEQIEGPRDDIAIDISWSGQKGPFVEQM